MHKTMTPEQKELEIEIAEAKKIQKGADIV